MSILPQLLVNALIAGSIYALATAGLSLVYGLLKIFNFAHGHLMMAGAYAFYCATALLAWSFLPAAAFALVALVVLAVLTLQFFILPFRRLNKLLPFVTTMALSSILEGLVSILFGVEVRVLPTTSAGDSLEIWGVFITPLQIIIIVTALVIMFGLAVMIHWTAVGRRIRAVSESEYAAEAIGITSTNVVLSVYCLGVVLAGLAGIMVGYEINMQPTMGGSYTLKAFAAMVLGGLGNIWGSIAGSYFLALVENLSIGLDFGKFSIPAGYKDAFAFVCVLLVLLFKPEGIFSRRGRKV